MNNGEEKLVERRVTYTLEHEGKFYIVENVPARVNEETRTIFLSYHSRTTAEEEDDSDAGQTEPSDSNPCV